MKLMFQRSVESFETRLKEYSGTQPVFFNWFFLDALCYAYLEGIPINQELKTYAEHRCYNTNVFILPPWKETLQPDAQSKHDWNQAVFTYNKMTQTYRGYQYELLDAPKVAIKERADFILSFIKNN